MSQDNKKSMVMYQGDGSNNVFAVPMTKGKYGTISVAFVRRGLDNYEYSPTTWTLNDENTLLTWTGDVLNVGDYIVIERTTARKQPYEFPNNQKHIERSDDNLERQIQEVADAADRALKLDPTYSIDSGKMNPVDWLQTILRSRDLSVRELRFIGGQLCYSTVDPESAEAEKTWTPVPNAFGFTSLRYVEQEVDGIKYRWIEAQKDGAWFPVAESTDVKAQQALDNSETAVSTANDAKAVAQEALTNSETAVSTANDAKAVAQEALDNSETAVSTANDAKAVADGIDAKAQEALDNSETAVSTSNDAKAIAQNAATDAENAVQTATNATDIANAANATAESAKTTATNANTKADAAVSTANSALQKANTAMAQSSDALADAAVSLENSEQAVATANAAKNTADGIDAKAQEALDNSETAVSTANDAKAVVDGIDAKINDVQGDVDTLNTKVPSNASASNKMATAAEISTLQNQIDENALDVAALQGAGGALNASNFNTATPTQETLTKYAVDQIWPGNTNWAWNAANPAASTFTSADGVSRTAAEIFNSTWVNNTYDDHRWQLTNTQNTTPKVFEWADVGRDIVSVATATTAGIVRVGSGSQMVVNPTTGDISLDGTKAESIRDTIGAVATNQGTANAGKLLGVDDDGNVAPVPNTMIIPTGTIIAFAGNAAPDGFLKCDGSAVLRRNYAGLFAVIGATYSHGVYAWKQSGTSEFVYTNFDRPATGEVAEGVYFDEDGTELGTAVYDESTATLTVTPTGGAAEPGYTRATVYDKPTFDLPDYMGVFLRGVGGNSSDIGILQLESVPNITGQIGNLIYGGTTTSTPPGGAAAPQGAIYYGGSLRNGSYTASRGSGSQMGNYGLGIDASLSNEVYGRRDEVAPKNYAVLFCIKY